MKQQGISVISKSSLDFVIAKKQNYREAKVGKSITTGQA
jgi:hypothetical protein